MISGSYCSTILLTALCLIILVSHFPILFIQRRKNEWEISERETEHERLLTLGIEREVVKSEVGGGGVTGRRAHRGAQDGKSTGCYFICWHILKKEDALAVPPRCLFLAGYDKVLQRAIYVSNLLLIYDAVSPIAHIHRCRSQGL